MTIFGLLRSRKHPNFVSQAREIENFLKTANWTPLLGLFRGLGLRIEKSISV